MKKTFAGLGVLALVALGATGSSFPAIADEVQPVAEIVAQSDAIIASPDAILSQAEPVVITSPAPEPVTVVAEPVVAPVELAAPVVVVEPVVVVAEAPVVAVAPAETLVVPAEGSTAYTVPSDSSQLQLGDAWAGTGTHYVTLDPAKLEADLTAECPITVRLEVARWCDFKGYAFPAQLMSSLYGPEPVAVTPTVSVPAETVAP